MLTSERPTSRIVYKKLFGNAAIYGITSAILRFLPFLLLPYIYAAFGPKAFSPFTDFYSVAGIIAVLLTHGMETTYFRYVHIEKDKSKVYSTALFSVLLASFLFLFFGLIFRKELAVAFKTPDQVHFLTWFILILVADAMCAIPFAKLRDEGRVTRYAFLKLSNAVLNFILVLFFLKYLPRVEKWESGILKTFLFKFYHPEWGVGIVFFANLMASIFTLILLRKEIIFHEWRVDIRLWKNFLVFALPIMFAGLAGIVNETLDRQFLKYLLPLDEARYQMGLYGAVYKVATFISLFKFAYLLGIEPFFFQHAKEKNSPKTYAILMNYFVIISSAILLFLLVNIPLVKIFLNNPEYYEGIKILPFVLTGTVFLGVYMNLSIWYKLTGKTIYGAYISGIGAIITILINVVGIPYFGYMACAVATFLSYFSMMLISYFWGRKHYEIKYFKRKFILYLGYAIVMGCINFYLFNQSPLIGNILFLLFLGLVVFIEKDNIQKHFIHGKIES